MSNLNELQETVYNTAFLVSCIYYKINKENAFFRMIKF